MTPVAWYAAYGSNTDADRFRIYLDGCTQPAVPADSRPVLIDLPLYFAGEGRAEGRWGLGGVAFTSVERDPSPMTLARAWLLPVDRIAEVGAQENGLPITDARLDLDAVRAEGVHRAYDRWYDAWVDCGELDGLPVVTLTSTARRTPINPPGPAYAAVVARGLRVTHGMTREAVAEYLSARTNLPVATLLEWQPEGEG